VVRESIDAAAERGPLRAPLFEDAFLLGEGGLHEVREPRVRDFPVSAPISPVVEDEVLGDAAAPRGSSSMAVPFSAASARRIQTSWKMSSAAADRARVPR
jgi:hypothetical protein